MAIPASPVVLLCPPNFVREALLFYVEHHQSLMLRAWFLHHEITQSVQTGIWTPNLRDWHTCVPTIRPLRLSNMRRRMSCSGRDVLRVLCVRLCVRLSVHRCTTRARCRKPSRTRCTNVTPRHDELTSSQAATSPIWAVPTRSTSTYRLIKC